MRVPGDGEVIGRERGNRGIDGRLRVGRLHVREPADIAEHDEMRRDAHAALQRDVSRGRLAVGREAPAALNEPLSFLRSCRRGRGEDQTNRDRSDEPFHMSDSRRRWHGSAKGHTCSAMSNAPE